MRLPYLIGGVSMTCSLAFCWGCGSDRPQFDEGDMGLGGGTGLPAMTGNLGTVPMPSGTVPAGSSTAPGLGAGGNSGMSPGTVEGNEMLPDDPEEETDAPNDPEEATDAPGGMAEPEPEPQACQAGEERSCEDAGMLGNCRQGVQPCVDGEWGECSIQPAAADGCDSATDDANCNGTPREGCACTTGETQPCGPDTTAGICEQGVNTCVDGAWNAMCVGAVSQQPRDCTSSMDNNCDGVPDDSEDECQCAPGEERECDPHPGFDSIGPCKPGTQTCMAGADGTTSYWSTTCVGAIGPEPEDSCTVDDNRDCVGQPFTGCDLSGPEIVSITPDDGDRAVGLQQNIVVTFSEAMDEAATEAAFTSSDIGSVSFQWNPAGTQLTINPNADFEYGTGTANSYSFQIGASATDLSANELETARSVTFYTLGRVSESLPLKSSGSATGVYEVPWNQTGSTNSTVCDFVDIFGTTVGVTGGLDRMAFVMFDISDLPDNIVEFQSATLSVEQSGSVQDAFKYGNAVLYSLFSFAPGANDVETVSLNVVGDISSSVNPGLRTRSVTSAISSDYANRDSQRDETQYLIKMGGSGFPYGTGDVNQAADALYFQCDTFELDVTYLVD